MQRLPYIVAVAGAALACDGGVPTAAPPVASVTVQPAAVTVTVGRAVQLAAVARDADGHPLTDRVVTWATGDPAIAGVSPSGWVTALAVGTALVTAHSEGQCDTATITVNPVPVASVAVEPASATLVAGDSLRLTATARDSADAVLTDRTITWRSGDSTVVAVSPAGLVRALMPGGAVITASVEGQRDSATITVAPPPDIGGVWDWTEHFVGPACHDTGSYVFAQQASRFSGASQQVGVCMLGSHLIDNTTGPDPVTGGAVSTSGVRFTVSGVCVYTGSLSGSPVDRMSGTATCGGASGTWQAVRSAPVGSVTTTPSSLTLLAGDSGRVQAAIHDTSGNRVFFRPITWSSDDRAVAEVSPDGRVLARAAGAAAVTATAEGQADTAAVTVLSAGALRVTATTTGADPDPDGYSVFVDGLGGGTLAVPSSGVIVFPALVPGGHTVGLGGVAHNCVVNGGTVRHVTVVATDTVEVAVDVVCARVVDHFAVAAYASDGKSHIYLMRGDASNAVRLTTDAAHHFQPAWSRDGTRIAFTAQPDYSSPAQIHVMNADGSNVVRLTDQHDNWAPRWSPDGRSIAYASRRDGDWDIYRMDADGSDATRLTTGVGWESQPAWSPDGARIAFVRRAPGESLSSIYVMNTDGSNAVRLTYGEQPDWSPDGTMIAFACCSTGTVDIYVMRADGSSVTRLTDSSTYDGSPSWSPDGRRIALVTLVDYGCDWSFCYWYVEPAVMQADGSGLAPLGTIDWSGDAGSVSWRPH